MEGVARHAVAHDFRQDGSAAPQGKAQFLQDEDARALADDEAVAVAVEGPAGLLRLVVARGKRAHGSEPAHPHAA